MNEFGYFGVVFLGSSEIDHKNLEIVHLRNRRMSPVLILILLLLW